MADVDNRLDREDGIRTMDALDKVIQSERPLNDEGWIEYGLMLLWSETDGYEHVADNAAAELASLREKAEAERDALKEERNKIAKHIRMTLDDGTAPSNLVDHVLLLMLQEYDPMVKRIQRLEAELRKAQGDE